MTNQQRIEIALRVAMIMKDVADLMDCTDSMTIRFGCASILDKVYDLQELGKKVDSVPNIVVPKGKP